MDVSFFSPRSIESWFHYLEYAAEREGLKKSFVILKSIMRMRYEIVSEWVSEWIVECEHFNSSTHFHIMIPFLHNKYSFFYHRLNGWGVSGNCNKFIYKNLLSSYLNMNIDCRTEKKSLTFISRTFGNDSNSYPRWVYILVWFWSCLIPIQRRWIQGISKKRNYQVFPMSFQFQS